MSIVETVKRIVSEVAQPIPGAEVVAPLAVWDGAAGSMGVQIKAPQLRGAQRCEVTAGFVLTRAELGNEHMIRGKAQVAVAAMVHDVQVQIRPLDRMPQLTRAQIAAANINKDYAVAG